VNLPDIFKTKHRQKIKQRKQEKEWGENHHTNSRPPHYEPESWFKNEVPLQLRPYYNKGLRWKMITFIKCTIYQFHENTNFTKMHKLQMMKNNKIWSKKCHFRGGLISALKPGPVVPPGIEKTPDQAARISQSVDFGQLSDILGFLGGGRFLTLFSSFFMFSFYHFLMILIFDILSLFVFFWFCRFSHFLHFCIFDQFLSIFVVDINFSHFLTLN